jgi:hypothetical protein
MKKILSLPLMVAFIYLASCNNATTDTVELKFKLPKGNKYEYAMNMQMTMNQKMMGKDIDMKNTMGFTYLFEVLNDSADWKTISSTISRISMDMDAMGRTMHFDTDMQSGDSTGPEAIMGKIFGAMKGSQFTFTVNDKGDIGEIRGLKEMREKMMSGLPVDEGSAAAGMGNAFDEENMKQNMQQAFQAYPGKPVKVGESWTKTTTQKIQGMEVKSENTYTLESVKGNDATVKVATKMNLVGSGEVPGGTMNLTGTGQGKTHYDLETGMTSDGDIDMKMDIKVKADTTEIPMSMNMKMKIKGKKI